MLKYVLRKLLKNNNRMIPMDLSLVSGMNYTRRMQVLSILGRSATTTPLCASLL